LGFNGDLYQESGADVVMTTTGDIVRYDSQRERYGIGTANQVLSVTAGLPAWKTLTLADSVLTTAGDVLYENNTPELARLPKGTDADVLTLASGLPSWSAPSTVIGQQDMAVPASAMWQTTTNGATALTATEYAENQPTYQSFDFNDSTEQHVQFTIPMPRNYNNGTITARFYWLASSSSGDVVWSIQGRAFSNDDAFAQSFGTEQTVTDTMTATNDVNISDFTSAMTLAGTPADADLIVFQVNRNASDGNDTLGADAKLLAIVFTYTLDASTT